MLWIEGNFPIGTIYAYTSFADDAGSHKEKVMKKRLTTPTSCPLSFFLRMLEFAETPAPTPTPNPMANVAPRKSVSAKVVRTKPKDTKKAMHPRHD